MKAEGKDQEPPWVECAGCGRRVQCVRVNDGTVYRPLAWVFASEAHPLAGLCRGCQPAPIGAGGEFTSFVQADTPRGGVL